MEIFHGTKPEYETVVALGNFDGLHRAHMRIINNCIETAAARNKKSGVMLFSKHTKAVMGDDVKLITDEAEKLDILRGSGVDFVYICDVDEAFLKMTPEDFAKWLRENLNAVGVCVGYDYRFAHRAQGDVEILRELGVKYGFFVMVEEEVAEGCRAIKSTDIRSCIENGDIETANALLGRRFTLRGDVEYGLQNGRKIGFPTANMQYSKTSILPKGGVYMGYTVVGDDKYKSVVNIGTNPTFCGERVTVESHLLDFDRDIYGEEIKIEFAKRIRDDIKFSGIDELKKQIASDAELAREELE